MFLVASAFAIALLGQEKAAPAAAVAVKTPVDRSAEPAVRSLFAESGALRGVHISIEIYPREEQADRYDDDSSLDIWIGDGGRFRILSSGNYWGGGSLWVSDGESLLSDDMSDDGSIRLSKPKKTLHELNEYEAVMFLLEGEKGFDALVQKDQPVKFVATSDSSEKVVELHTEKLGMLQLHYREGAPLPYLIDSYQVPWWEDDKTKVPEKPSSREQLRIVSHGMIDTKLFSTAPPKGKKVVDEREKKG